MTIQPPKAVDDSTPPGYEVALKKFHALLLDDCTLNINGVGSSGKIVRSGRQEEIRTTPLFSLKVKCTVDNLAKTEKNGHVIIRVDDSDTSDDEQQEENKDDGEGSLFPQYGLLGFKVGDGAQNEEPLPGMAQHEPIFMNVDAPNSTFICGSQGAGKSYTLSTMLENLLVDNEDIGKLRAPVAGLVFHYDANSTVCTAETASLCSLGIPVKVLVSQSNYHKLESKYRALAKNGKLSVEPLLLQSADLSVERILKLMAFDQSEGTVPLYLEVMQQILRDMNMQVDTQRRPVPFSYATFKQRMTLQSDLSPAQRAPLNLRLQILESFLDLKSKKTNASLLDLKPGTLTIIDLSDPFVNASTSCALFDICLSIVQQRRTCGLAVVLDEAHKFMNRSAAADTFTDRLLTTIREQRHNGTRVIIATQEPTVSESLLDLCSTTIVHRFSSPAWFETIKRHLAGASTNSSTRQEMFERITALDTGESLVFTPTSYLLLQNGEPMKLRNGVVHMKTRMRRGVDAGMSLLAQEQVGRVAKPKPKAEGAFAFLAAQKGKSQEAKNASPSFDFTFSK